MRLQELEHTPEEIAHIIRKDCQPYLQSRETLYRGLPIHDLKFAKLKGNKNRKPANSPIEFHDFMNDVFAKIGSKVNRSNSIFASGNYGEAARYTYNKNTKKEKRDPYVIFPIGDFNTIWSNDIQDFMELLYYYETDLEINVTDIDIDKFISEYKWHTNLGRDYYNGDSEIMIDVDYYYVLDKNIFKSIKDRIYAST